MKSKTIFAAVFFLCAAVSASAADSFTANLEKMIKAKGLKKSSLGLAVSKIHSNGRVSEIYKLNAQKAFIPASLTKIAALPALYNYYPPSYTFKTFFMSSAPLQKGVLKGGLVLKGGGDSSFTSESLWMLVDNLTRSGIKKVEGDLFVDGSLYKKEPPLPYSERSYSAPSSSASFNWNSVAFYIRPDKSLGRPAKVFAGPESHYIKIINKASTGRSNRIQIRRVKAAAAKEVFEVRGQIDIKNKEIVKYRSITQPALWLGENALSFLNQRGIKVLGRVKKGGCSKPCRLLAEWESRPMPFHSYNLMKYSSNFVVRMLAMHLPLLPFEGERGFFQSGKKGDLKAGMQKIRFYLEKKEGLKNFTLEEPSGLSRRNRFSPKDLRKILINSQEKPYSPEMLFSYPLAGGKGTLEKRFKNLPSSSFVRAKTGSLFGVSGLAGFAGSSKKNGRYVFVFIFNGPHSQSLKAQELFDEAAASLAR